MHLEPELYGVQSILMAAEIASPYKDSIDTVTCRKLIHMILFYLLDEKQCQTNRFC